MMSQLSASLLPPASLSVALDNIKDRLEKMLTLILLVTLGWSASIVGSLQMNIEPKSVLIVGGTRFSGLYLWRELHKRGHSVTLFNRGKTALKKVPHETEDEFERRSRETRFIKGNRQSPDDLKKLASENFDVIYDMNGREQGDTAPLADIFRDKAEHFVYMSSAGVYKKSTIMPHIEGDAEDVKSRHKGKSETETYLKQIGVPFTSIRPTYIYGAMNYNPLEEYFFERLDANRPICIPGHGQHVTGLGHVQDLAVAMAQVIGRDKAKGQIYNIQDAQSITFEGLARLAGKAMGKDPAQVEIKFYDKKNYDFGEKKAFPMREQHFFCAIDKAVKDLDWYPRYNLHDGLRDAYEHDFLVKKAAGSLKTDFSCDDLVLNGRVEVQV